MLHWLSRRVVLAVSIGSMGLLTFSIAVRAHEAHPYHGDAPMTIGAVLAISVIAGLSIGGTIVVVETRRWQRIPDGIGRSFGPVLVMVGLTYAVPAVQESVIQSAIGGLGGGIAIWLLSTRTRGRHHVTGTVSAILVHRIVEGVILAAGYLAGSTVGLVGALIIAGHASIESAAVGGFAASEGWVRAIIAVLIVQVGFVAGAIVGSTTVVAYPGQFHVFLLAGGAGALCVIGVIESTDHH